MTIENQDLVAGDAAPLLTQTVIDAESFQVCRSELQDFVAEARNRLASISEAIAQAQGAEPAHHQPEQTQIPSEPEPAPIQVQAVCEEPQQPEQQFTPPEDFVIDSPACDTDDDDPIERLNAIKRRLADQMQNAS